jgi:hypothetical protein
MNLGGIKILLGLLRLAGLAKTLKSLIVIVAGLKQ